MRLTSASVVVAFALGLVGASTLRAGAINHVTDGQFGPNEWDSPPAIKTTFAVAGGAGGADLYVNTGTVAYQPALYVLVDYFNAPNVDTVNFFDVYTTLADGNHYGIRIKSGADSYSVYQKSSGSPPSGVRPDGSLDFTDPVWSASSISGLHTFLNPSGVSPAPLDPANPILELRFDRSLAKSGMFFGVAAGTLVDPPISSAIFTLDPDGTVVTGVSPVLGPSGAPTLQPLPLPATLPAATALLAAVALRRRR